MSNTAATPDPKVQRMKNDPVAYLAEARKRARETAVAATRRERELRRRKA